MTLLYPDAVWLADGGSAGDGNGWGPLPDRGATQSQIRLVFHTTETSARPGYSGGKFAPHTTYDPKTRSWFQHGRFDRRMGTLLGRSRTGVLGNEFSVQTEIICYSDRKIADQSPGRIWVGDLTDDHYGDLARYVAWCRVNLGIPLVRAYGPSRDFETFIYGRGESTEMSKPEWLKAGGILTGHGAGPGQLHWDTGVLDLHRIIDESMPGPHDALAEAEESAIRTLALIREARRQ